MCGHDDNSMAPYLKLEGQGTYFPTHTTVLGLVFICRCVDFYFEALITNIIICVYSSAMGRYGPAYLAHNNH